MNYFIGEWFADLCILQSYLDEIDFYSGTERKQMLKKNNIELQLTEKETELLVLFSISS